MAKCGGDLTRADLRQLIRRGLQASGGNYRALLDLFGMDANDYKKLMNFLAAHKCAVDFREYRHFRGTATEVTGGVDTPAPIAVIA